MAIFRNQFYLLAFFVGIHRASAGLFTNFRFSDLLYAFHLCTHESDWCPVPPCDWKPKHQPEICDYYFCRDVEDSDPPKHKQRECTLTEDCDGDPDCEATQQHLQSRYGTYSSGGSNLYASDSSTGNTAVYQADSTVEDTDTGSHDDAASSAHWGAYAVLGALLTAFLMYVVWRKRTTIDNAELGEGLGPQGEDLNGAVARHHLKAQEGDYVMA